MYDDEEDRDMLYGVGHETLFIRKTLVTLKVDSRDDWLRTNIFYITYTIVDKI